MQAFAAGIAVFFGELLIIGIEMVAARYFGTSPAPFRIFLYALCGSVLACALLVYGYTYGYQSFKNIWIITAISVSSILVVEPLIAWLLFKQQPTLGAAIAIVLAAVGTATTLLIK